MQTGNPKSRTIMSFSAILGLPRLPWWSGSPRACTSLSRSRWSRCGGITVIHADNPEKAQYSAGDIQLINGFDIRDYVEMTKSEVMRYKRELLAFVRDNDILEYSDLLDILMDGGEATADLLEVASNHTLMLTKYIASRRYKVTGVSRGDD